MESGSEYTVVTYMPSASVPNTVRAFSTIKKNIKQKCDISNSLLWNDLME